MVCVWLVQHNNSNNRREWANERANELIFFSNNKPIVMDITQIVIVRPRRDRDESVEPLSGGWLLWWNSGSLSGIEVGTLFGYSLWGLISQGCVYPAQTRPVSGGSGRWPTRWRPRAVAVTENRGSRFWLPSHRAYKSLTTAHYYLTLTLLFLFKHAKDSVRLPKLKHIPLFKAHTKRFQEEQEIQQTLTEYVEIHSCEQQ